MTSPAIQRLGDAVTSVLEAWQAEGAAIERVLEVSCYHFRRSEPRVAKGSVSAGADFLAHEIEHYRIFLELCTRGCAARRPARACAATAS